MKRPDLLILVAIWEFLAAFGALIGISAIAIFAFPNTTWMWGMNVWHMGGVGAVFGLSIAMLVLLAFMGISIAGGIGLLAGKEWGRLLSIAQAGISLLWIPFGTVIGILIIIYLTKPDAREYFTGGGS